MITSSPRPHLGLYACLLGGILSIASITSRATSIEEETLVRLDQIRAVHTSPDNAVVEAQNKQMDEVWKYFREHKADVLPILQRELARELESPNANQLILLDTGYFLRLQGDPTSKDLGKKAFLTLDPKAEIIQWNKSQLFNLAHSVAQDRDPQALGQIDKAFLRSAATVYVPQHALKLTETLIGVFLYGLYGQEGERHLTSLLIEPALQLRIVEILTWIGSPQSVPEVAKLLNDHHDFDTFGHVMTFMMKVGGPQGRQVMLDVKPEALDEKAQGYYAKVRKAIEQTTFQTYRDGASKLPNGEALDGEQLKKRLAVMYEKFGRDDALAPKAILDSHLPKEFLISQLEGIRSRTFYRVSDEALSDVEVTNLLLNALEYRAD